MQQLILHFSQDFRVGKPQLGGYSRILNQLRDGNTHLIFTIGLSQQEYEIKVSEHLKVKVVQFGLNTLNYFSLIKQPLLIIRIAWKIHQELKLRNLEPNILVGHSQLFNFYVLLLLRNFFLNKSRIIWEFNVIWGFENEGRLKNLIRSKIQKCSQKLVSKQADGLIFQTKSCRDFIFQKYALNKKNIIVLNSIRPAINFQESLKSRTRDAILVYGLFDDLNGIKFLMQFLVEYSSQLKFEFHFYGSGEYTMKLKELAEVFPRIKFFGSVSKDEISEVIQKYQFSLIPRINTLGSQLYIPTKIIELMNFGTIVIASDVDGMKEVIKDNYNGFVFKNNDRIDLYAKLLKIQTISDVEIQFLVDNGVNTIKEHFNLDIQLEKQKEFYREFS
jgi:glycosyltransferase involved in cell wall biosynthesis